MTMLFAVLIVRLSGDLEGRVLNLAGAPIPHATVSVPAFARSTQTDAIGRFTLADLPGDELLVVVRATGYRPDTLKVRIPEGRVLVRDFVLSSPRTTLPEVLVKDSVNRGTMRGLDERRRSGVGRFLDREALAKVEHRSLSVVLSSVPGIAIFHGAGDKAWAFTTRSVNPDRCAFCRNTDCGPGTPLIDGPDCSAGARKACYMDIYVDGTLSFQYGQFPPMPLFNVNSLQPSQIEAIEVYASASQVPAQYNRTSSAGCGAMVIWTRVGR